MTFSDLKFESAQKLDPETQKLFDTAVALAKEIGDRFTTLTEGALTEGHPNHRDPRGIQTVQLAALSTVASQLIGSAPPEIRETVLKAFLNDLTASARHTMARADEFQRQRNSGRQTDADMVNALLGAIRDATAAGRRAEAERGQPTINIKLDKTRLI